MGLKKTLYLFSGIPLYNEFKKPKEEKNKKNLMKQGVYFGITLKVAWLLTAYTITTVDTGDWNPINHVKSFVGKIFPNKEIKKNLEKTILIEDFD